MDFKNSVARAIDQDVQELEKLKMPSGPHSQSISMVKTQESSYTNNNGKEKTMSKMKQQLNKNGELMAKLEEKMSSKNDRNGQPDTKVQVSVDIPSKGIHKHTSYTSDDEPPRKRNEKYKEYDKKNFASMDSLSQPFPLYFNTEATPEDMAEYIFFTKDDKSVTEAIEKLIQEGRLDRESALAYLSMIDRELYRLDARYSDPMDMNKDIENPIKYQKIEPSDFSDIDGSLTELKEMQQILREKFTKKSKDMDEEDYNSKRIERIRKILEAKLRMSDSQYSRLLETVASPSDITYAQTMMDEIIYQLAKLMFNQGLFIGGLEAQESLQKFTDFLETEASRGRISRALEKKILDLLITSLSDTLTEHPELMAAAKEGFSKYLDAYPNSESNAVQKKNELDVRRDEETPKIRFRKRNADTQKVKSSKPAERSLKTSGIEDDDKN